MELEFSRELIIDDSDEGTAYLDDLRLNGFGQGEVNKVLETSGGVYSYIDGTMHDGILDHSNDVLYS